jgi:peroxiredoxin
MMKGLRTLFPPADKLSFFVITFGVALLVMNILLVQQNKQLDARANQPEKPMQLQPGKDLTPLEGVDINGNSLTIGYREDERKTLLLVFSPHCNACKDNMPNWEAIIKGIDRSAYRVVAASVKNEEVREYVSKYDFSDVPVIADVDPRSRVDYVMAVSPQTILINADGKAEKVWLGKFKDKDKEEISRTLDIQFQ